jgi:hypothetical protein
MMTSAGLSGANPTMMLTIPPAVWSEDEHGIPPASDKISLLGFLALKGPLGE